MKSSNFVLFLLTSFVLSSAALGAPKPVLKCTVKGGQPESVTPFELPDQTSIRFLGAPIFIHYIDKAGSAQVVQLNVAFGSPQRILQASWAQGSYAVPNGFSVRPVVATMRSELAPGKTVDFQFGDDELSPNPAITLSCQLDPSAGKYDPAPDCGNCPGGGASASN